MYLYVRRATRQICDASNIDPWSRYAGAEMEVVETDGDAETYPWPNGDRVRCLCTAAGEIVGDPAWVDTDAVRDAYVAAKSAITTMAANAAIPADARQAVVKLGLCVEELLKYLKKRIA